MLNTVGVFVIFAFTIIHRGSCFGSGAPPWQCENMRPIHRGAPPQRGPSPYFIRVQTPFYTPGQGLRVSIMSSSDDIKGYFIQARILGGRSAIGGFSFRPRSAKFLNCANRRQSAVTHSTRLNVRVADFVWVPPADVSGNVVFYATVVKDMTTFWVGLRSPVLTRRDPRVRQ